MLPDLRWIALGIHAHTLSLAVNQGSRSWRVSGTLQSAIGLNIVDI